MIIKESTQYLKSPFAPGCQLEIDVIIEKYSQERPHGINQNFIDVAVPPRDKMLMEFIRQRVKHAESQGSSRFFPPVKIEIHCSAG